MGFLSLCAKYMLHELLGMKVLPLGTGCEEIINFLQPLNVITFTIICGFSGV